MTQRLLTTILENAVDGIILINQNGEIRLVNPAVGELFGYPNDELLGHPIEKLMIKSDARVHQMYINAYQQTGRPYAIGKGREVIGLKKDRTQFPLRLAVSEIIIDNETFFTGILHDLTKEKQAEETLKNYAVKLERLVAEKTSELTKNIVQLEKVKEELGVTLEKEKALNRMKSRFVSMASHEFRSPLSNIQLSAALVENYYDRLDRERVMLHLKKIKLAVSDLTNTLNDFLSVERIEAGKVNPVFTGFDIRNFGQEVTNEAILQLKRGQQFSYRHLTDLAEITLDRNLLKHCILNLVTNAIKYSGEDAIIELTTKVDGGTISIVVQDTGIGIPEKDQRNLFTPFFRAGNTGDIPGTGLGLSIVHNYVGLMNGEISCESSEGKGSKFTVVFRALAETAVLFQESRSLKEQAI